MRIAALYVEADGVYADVADVELWDEARDARLYRGPYPVVAHPPCARWCRMAGIAEARWGKRRGDDGGTFAAALEAVRTHGGVLEHPAYSAAWKTFGLPRPHRNGGWFGSNVIGWSAHVEQGRYGHSVKKATWLYAYNADLPQLRWGSELDQRGVMAYSWCGNNGDKRPRVGKKIANATPIEFRDVLMQIARSALRSEKGERP